VQSQIIISELFTASNTDITLRNEKYVEIYNPLSCEISLDGWELEIISNCNITLLYDLSGLTIGGNQAMRFSSSDATLFQTAAIPGFNYANNSGNLNLQWNGQQRDGARLINPAGITEDFALPNNNANCGLTIGFYQNARLVRQANICQGNTTFSFAEWSLVSVATIGNLPVFPTHNITCIPPPIGTAGLWTGASNNDWHNCSNWSDFQIPNATTDVIIDDTANNFCLISSANAVCNSLTVSGSTVSDISLQIINGFELDVFADAFLIRDGGDGFSAIILDNGRLDISGDLNITLNSPITTSSILINLSTGSANLLTCDDIISQNLSPVFNTIDFNMDANSGNIQCDNFVLTGNGINGTNDFNASFGISSSTLEIDEDLTISNQGRMDFRSGNLNISGHLYDNNISSSGIIFGLTNSTYQFKGSADQTINSFHTIRLNNMSLLNVLGASVILNTDVEINGALNLGNDFIQLNDQVLFIEDNDPSAVFGSGGIVCESQTFAGRIDWYIGDNPDLYTFPFATAVGGTVIPFIFDMTMGETDRVEVSTYGTGQNNLPYPPGVSSLDNITSPGFAGSVVDRWWLIEAPDEGNLLVDVTFTYANSEEHIMGCVACTNAKRHTGTMWETGFQDNTPIYNDPPFFHQVGIQGISTFSPWGISTLNEPLPVELLNFEAKLIDQSKTELNWDTGSEINTALFEIERSIDGFDFTNIGNVLASGNSSELIHYNFIDDKPFNGENYYRLKMLDLNGAYEYSNTKVVDIRLENITIQSIENGYFISTERNVEFTLYDLGGRLISKQNSNFILFENLSPGLYFLEVREGNEIVESFKLLF